MVLEHCESGMKKFVVERPHDETGVSGTGVVVEGVVFTTGQCVVHWLTPAPHGCIVVWNSFEDFHKVHIDPHPENHTVIHWFKGTDEEDVA